MKYFIAFLLIISSIADCDIQEAAKQFRLKSIDHEIPAYETNPYENTDEQYQEQVFQNLFDHSSVCAIKFDDQKQIYSLQTFQNKEEAEKSEFIVTHQGKCGSCSTLQDLAVYLTTDLTRPVRKCGLNHFRSKSRLAKCIKDLGFTDTCTQIWVDNTLYTKKKCFAPCMYLQFKIV